MLRASSIVLTGVGCGALFALGIACSSASDDGGAFGAYGDGGSMGAEASAAADGFGGDVGALAPPPRVLVVHASPELWPFRLCLADSAAATGTTTPRNIAPWPDDPSHPAPMSNFPAVAVGSGALWSEVGEATSAYVVPYVVDALELANSPEQAAKTCDKLVCTGGSCLEQGMGWYALDAVPATTFMSSGAILLAITGCPPGPGTTTQCGSDFVASTGNLHATWTPLDDTGASDAAAVQVAQLSPDFGAATVTSGLADDAALATSLAYLGVAPQAELPVPPPSAPGMYETVTLTATGDTASLTLSLADIARFTDPALLPSDLFSPTANLLVAVVGDPSSSVAQVDAGPDATYDGHGLHMIAVALDPSAPDAGN